MIARDKHVETHCSIHQGLRVLAILEDRSADLNSKTLA